MKLWSIARVSSTGQDTEGQVPANQRWADANGHTITRTVELKASAYKPSKLAELLEEATNAKPDGIVLRRADRLSRQGIRHGLDMMHRFRTAGVKVFLADMGDDAIEADDMLMSALFYGAYKESKVKSDRATDNHMVIADHKAWMGVPPFGYTVVSNGTLNAQLVPSEDEARIVVEMFKRCADGGTLRGLERWAASLGYVRPTPRGVKSERPWKPTGAQIRKILDREAYATGQTELTSTPKDRDGNVVESKRRTWTHEHAALISRELFDAAQASKNERRTRENYDRDDTILELEGAVTCVKCGHKMYLRNKKINGRYYERYECRCGHGMRRDKLVQFVAGKMTGHIMVTNVERAPVTPTPQHDELTRLRKELSRCNPATDDGWERATELRARMAELESSDTQAAIPVPMVTWVDVSEYSSQDWAGRRELCRQAGITI